MKSMLQLLVAWASLEFVKILIQFSGGVRFNQTVNIQAIQEWG